MITAVLTWWVRLLQCLHDKRYDYRSAYMIGEMITVVFTWLMRWLLPCLHDCWDDYCSAYMAGEMLPQCLHDWRDDYCSAYITGEMIATALTRLVRWLLSAYMTGEITTALTRLVRLLQPSCNCWDDYCSAYATDEMFTAALVQLARWLLQHLLNWWDKYCMLFHNLCCVKVCTFPAVIHNARSVDQMEFMDILLWRCGSVATFFPFWFLTHTFRDAHTHTDSHLQNNTVVVISIALYLTNKGEHTVHYKIKKNIYIKPQKQ